MEGPQRPQYSRCHSGKLHKPSLEDLPVYETPESTQLPFHPYPMQDMLAMKSGAEVNEQSSGGSPDGLEIDHQAEKALVRKIDRFIVPTVMMTYLLCFLDRTNIGNARLFGLEEDLGLVGDQYQLAVAVLFVPYVLVEVPSNLVLKKFTPSRWIAFITVGWGIVSTLTGVVQSFAGLIACRVILGLLEGGLFPGLTVYLTLFYTKKELALRIGYLFVSSALAGACGGLLAYGIGFMDGIAGQSGWRWIFIIEGIPTVMWGIALWFLLANDPQSAWYLDDSEKQLLLARLQRQTGFHEEFDKKDAILAAKDWKVWLFAAGQFGVNSMLYSYSIFLPSIIRGKPAPHQDKNLLTNLSIPRPRSVDGTTSSGAYSSLLYSRHHQLSCCG